MPPTLDLPNNKRAKMIVSPPRLNLRRAASYQGSQAHDRVPLSASSSRFSFNYLLFSPPPSPGLPALVSRPRKSPTLAPRPSRVLRILGWMTGVIVFLYVARAIIGNNVEVPAVKWALVSQPEYEMVGQYDLPEFPTPIAVTDRRGRSRWTVSIPPTSAFPLTVKEYSDICSKCQEAAAHVRELDGRIFPSQQVQQDYYYRDPYFLDVSDAEKRGLLPGVGKSWQVISKAQDGNLVGVNKDGLVERSNTCKTSLTFVLESSDAGIGRTLMMLWMAYGLAQKEGRAFFIDDTRWAYGDYTDIFKAPPVPECNPPPRHEMLPCPHHARHLVVSVATATETFGNSFAAKYELEKRDVSRERPMYNLARIGYEALFHLNDDDQLYVSNRIQELKGKAKVPKGNHNDGTIIGVHVRHGDLHPFEYQYSSAYLPLNLYSERAREILEDYHNTSAPGRVEDLMAKHYSFIAVASDDPEVYEAEELTGSVRAQEQINLASKTAINQANPDKSVMHKFVDETFGWEGGFFASMFWNLGRSTLNNANAADSPTSSLGPSSETMRLRGLMGRAYMMDLAVLGQVSDVVICTVSAMGCRLVAVIMGWDKAIDQERWVNIDGEWGLSLL